MLGQWTLGEEALGEIDGGVVPQLTGEAVFMWVQTGDVSFDVTLTAFTDFAWSPSAVAEFNWKEGAQ